MRPIANFTVHALLAAAIAALATASAASGPTGGTEEVYFKITLQEARAQDGKGQHLEVHSFQWGVATSPLKLERNYVKSWSTSGDAATPRGTNQMTMDDTAGKEEAAAGSQASGRVTGIASDPSEPASGQATGKRQHKPLLMRGYYDQAPPPARGNLTVLASGAPCRIGARYPSLSLSGGGKDYLLQDVRVAACGDTAAGPEEQITFVYGRVTVRGWDPKSRQQ
jgi:hypothetical protein